MTTTPCADDPAFFLFGDPALDCAWAATNPAFRCALAESD
eukprot:CAMPEP_0194334994 /NCGR_PEP_ID=MMETSP0171-20130528/68033_1 /TAXON_ID=218684 /ORGANISM="Corethron pennatum, Strain L29A3" /LENGTH=39 /DNA_ID= /DNA_START= /DNA_END= /DNA_ORIENTATION=